MRTWLNELIICPVCSGSLNIQAYTGSNDDVIEGILLCGCDRWYPIINGVPRMIWGKFRHDYSEFLARYRLDVSKYVKSEDLDVLTTGEQVKATFSTIWDKFPNFGINDKGKQEFYDKWMAQKLGMTSNAELYSFINSKKTILEVGIGSGQKLKMMAEHTDGKVVGIDLTSSVEHAARNTANMQNVAVIQADLFALPFKQGSFDFIISDGVLHHTPDTKRAFLSIVPFLAVGGDIAIRVYSRGTPIREFCDDYIRSYTTKMSQAECWEFCACMARLGEALAKAHSEIEIPDDIELLGFKKGSYDLQRFVYYNMFKCFYNDAFNLDENVLVNFDWYSPIDAHRHTADEVRQWYVEAGLQNIRIYDPESGISAIGNKA